MLDWWVYLVVAGIIFCGYKFLEEVITEHRRTEAQIEEEGKEYIERMQDEKEKRRLTQTS